MKMLQMLFNIIFSLVGWISSSIAIWSIIESENQFGFFVFVAVIFILSVLYIFLQIKKFKNDINKNFIHSTEDGVNTYLYDWIHNGGRTVIFTRDFTWANCNHKMVEMLRRKAERKELIICLYRETEMSRELSSLGAEVLVHGNENLRSRFVITNYGTNNPQITVGLRDNNKFINQRYSMKNDSHIYNIFVELFETTKTSIEIKKTAQINN